MSHLEFAENSNTTTSNSSTGTTATMEEASTPTQHFYLVECCSSNVSFGGVEENGNPAAPDFVAVSGSRLEKLFDLMPTLQYLLLGNQTVLKKSDQGKGLPILVIPSELKVTKKSFLLLLHNALELDFLPLPGSAEWSDLLTTITNLGGCEALEERLKNCILKRGPMTPEEDTEGKYNWQIAHGHEELRSIKAQDMAKAGFSYTTSIPGTTATSTTATNGDSSNRSSMIHIYRKAI